MRRNRGFTMLEMLIASALFAYFTMLLMELNILSSKYICRMVGRTNAVTESKLAYHYISNDINGALNVTWNGAGEVLTIKRSDSSIYEYHVDDGKLVRTPYGTSDELTVAMLVTGWSARTTTFGLDVDLTFSSGAVERRVRVHRSFPQT